MGLYWWLVKVSWLGKLVSVFCWVELDFLFLECNEVDQASYLVAIETIHSPFPRDFKDPELDLHLAICRV